MVDSNDKERLYELMDMNEISRLLKEDDFQQCPLLVIANKQDLVGALSIAEVADILKLHEIRDRPWCEYRIKVCKLQHIREKI